MNTTEKFAHELTLTDTWWRKPSEPCRILALWFTGPERDRVVVRYQDPYTAPECCKTDVLDPFATLTVSDPLDSEDPT